MLQLPCALRRALLPCLIVVAAAGAAFLGRPAPASVKAPVQKPATHVAVAPALKATSAEVRLEPVMPARPFVLAAGVADRERAVQCLTQAVYYEAGFEPLDGERAVAQVVLNRVRHPIFPHTVCGVVFQGAEQKTGCQFTFACDGSLDRPPQKAAWDRARRVAEAALDGAVATQVGEATHYHTQDVSPWWEGTVARITQVGAHIFYRWPGALGLPGAFNQRYAGHEQIALAAPAAGVTVQADGRVSATLTPVAAAPDPAPAADPAPASPHARMLALAARRGLGEQIASTSQSAAAD